MVVVLEAFHLSSSGEVEVFCKRFHEGNSRFIYLSCLTVITIQMMQIAVMMDLTQMKKTKKIMKM